MISSLLRAKSLQAWNVVLGALFTEKSCSFIHKGTGESRGNSVVAIAQFADRHHFFSIEHPLIGVVTDQERDVWLVADLLKLIFDKIPQSDLDLMTMEVVTKILAFRSLREGMELLIPMQKRLVTYIVDKVILLDKAMPMFGLIAKQDNAPSLLLFRGTELSWKGRRSILSDLDLKGAGHTCFLKAQPQISAWLNSAHEPQALGFSLGGILAAYALLYNPKTVVSATIFGPPGFTGAAYKEWQGLNLDERLTVYVTRGDCVPKYGHLVGTIKEFSLPKKLRPISAHTQFITAEPSYLVHG